MQNPRPWEVPLEEYLALQTDLGQQEKNSPLVKLAIKLTERLSNGTKYGHVAGYLYGRWTMSVGRDAVAAHWAKYDAWQASFRTKREEEKKAVIAKVENSIDDLFG